MSLKAEELEEFLGKMRFILILLIFYTIDSTNSEVCKCVSNSSENHRHEFSHSIIYGLTNVVEGFELDRCKKELLLIKEGVERKDIWALKRKCLFIIYSLKNFLANR